jgi:hypothetical protein
MSEATKERKELIPSAGYTPFALKVIEYLKSCKRVSDQSTWHIAICVFPKNWDRRKSRGGLIAQIRNLPDRYPETFGWIPPQDRWGEGTLFFV